MSLEQLASKISQVLPDHPDQVKGLIQEYLLTKATDWQEYVTFSTTHYTRNHVITTPQCELIIMCWNSDQNTLIHDHGTSDCWMAVLAGQMKETVYAAPDDLFQEYEIQMRPIFTVEYTPGQVGHISNQEGIHEIGAIHSSSVTLHVYAPPLKKIRLFCRSTDNTHLKVDKIVDVDNEWI
jgi:cysteine dioxygenase